MWKRKPGSTDRPSKHRKEKEVEVVWWREGREGRARAAPASNDLCRELLVGG